MRTKPRSTTSSFFALTIVTAGMIAAAVAMATTPADAGPRGLGGFMGVSEVGLGSGR